MYKKYSAFCTYLNYSFFYNNHVLFKKIIDLKNVTFLGFEDENAFPKLFFVIKIKSQMQRLYISKKDFSTLLYFYEIHRLTVSSRWNWGMNR